MLKGGSWWSVLSDWHFCCPVTAADASGRAGKGESRQQEEDEQDGGLTQVRPAYLSDTKFFITVSYFKSTLQSVRW